MIENFRYKGFWKLPSQPKWRVAGELNFDTAGGIKLELLGNLYDSHSGHQNFETIQGYTSNGKTISIFGCRGATSNAMPGFTTSSFHADYMIVGAHYSRLEEVSIESVAVHFLYLDQWVNVHGIKIEMINEEPYKVQMTYTHPPPISLYKDDIKDILLWFSSSNPMSGSILDNTIKQKTYLNVEYKTSASVAEILKDIQMLRNFLSFGLSRVIVATEILIYPKRGGPKYSLIYHEAFYPKVNNSHEHIFDYTSLFMYHHIDKFVNDMMEKWHQKYISLQPVFDRYFDCIYNPKLFQINQFLNLMFAIETYHRRTFDTLTFPTESFNDLKKSLSSALPVGKEFQEWFKNKFQYANEASLRQRLKDIFKDFDPILKELEGKPKDFISKLVQTRNYYVHYDQSSVAGILGEEDLRTCNSTLVILLQLLLLKELGFTSEQRTAAVKRSLPNWDRFKKGH
jgi:hypothetical protein